MLKPVPTVLYILCGLPFSGKSTLAGVLHERCGIELVSIDAIKTEHGHRDVWQEMTAGDWESIFDESFRLVRQSLERGAPVIHDSANQTRQSRDALKAIAHELGVSARVIFVDVTPELARQRWQANKTRTTRMDLPQWAFEAALANYEPPGRDEHPLIYTPSDQADPDDWIAKKLGCVR